MLDLSNFPHIFLILPDSQQICLFNAHTHTHTSLSLSIYIYIYIWGYMGVHVCVLVCTYFWKKWYDEFIYIYLCIFNKLLFVFSFSSEKIKVDFYHFSFKNYPVFHETDLRIVGAGQNILRSWRRNLFFFLSILSFKNIYLDIWLFLFFFEKRFEDVFFYPKKKSIHCWWWK